MWGLCLAVLAACTASREGGPSQHDPDASRTDPNDAGGAISSDATSVPPPGTGPAPASGGAPLDAALEADSSAAKNNGFPAHWTDGLACATDPKVQVWAYDASTYILRQSLCTSFEGPFVYLLLGQKKALLIDTGTGSVNLAGTVTALVADWQKAIGASSIDLVVAHSHSHGDHVGADKQFANLPKTTVVGLSVAAVSQFFGITTWPTQNAELDLGERVLDIVPIPGHQAAHLAVYDRRDALLLSGDTLYPGRLYIDQWAAYGPSVKRLAGFVHAGHPVAWILGGHIELTRGGPDFAYGSTEHPDEHVLQLGAPELDELDSAVQAMGATPKRQAHADFIVSP